MGEAVAAAAAEEAEAEILKIVIKCLLECLVVVMEHVAALKQKQTVQQIVQLP